MRTLLPFLLLTGCPSASDDSGTKGDDTAGGDTSTTFDDATLAAELWTAMTDFHMWTVPDGWSTTPVASEAHMGGYVVTYMNSTLAGWDWMGEAPAGSISVKENFTDGTGATLDQYTVMQKVTGYDAEHGDWFWAAFAEDGTVNASGKVEMCWGCHVNSTTDYVFADPPGGM